MAQQKKKQQALSSSALRLPKDIMKQMREHAERETRTVPGQITVALKEWLAMKEATVPQQVATNPVRSAETKRTAAHHPESSVPQDVARSIVDSEEGWEGTNIRTLSGTKVKP